MPEYHVEGGKRSALTTLEAFSHSFAYTPRLRAPDPTPVAMATPMLHPSMDRMLRNSLRQGGYDIGERRSLFDTVRAGGRVDDAFTDRMDFTVSYSINDWDGPDPIFILALYTLNLIPATYTAYFDANLNIDVSFRNQLIKRYSFRLNDEAGAGFHWLFLISNRYNERNQENWDRIARRLGEELLRRLEEDQQTYVRIYNEMSTRQ
jgi:hypothetical protein